ncbi:MAG TPA: glycosyltransferase family 4 protein [Chitinophagaceae bacterium]|nr:glycosyltransferase family 4 protein [Chitinophagaceae bacterium]
MKRLAIVTNCCDDWGGSEELWALSIPHLQQSGASVTVLKDKINRKHPRFAELANKGVTLRELDLISKKKGKVQLMIKGWKKLRGIKNPMRHRFERFLRNHRPDLVLVSQAINFDGLVYADACAAHKIPYVIVSQKAVEFYWPPTPERDYMRRAFQNAEKCFFVSKHNQELTEEQFGVRFNNARLIHNPVKLSFSHIPYPSTGAGYKLACIGRLFIIDKGQDILLRILSQPKWRARALTVTFIGSGVDEQALRSMAKLLNVTNAEFAGYASDMREVWRNHHALVLPSRSEGLPLVVLEAMAAGRTVISTKAGGTPEIVKDGETGFIGDATLDAFEAVLERAWNNRHEWEQMGRDALAHISQQILQSPEEDLANTLTELLYEP